jgi:hypothetical protein
VLPFSTVFSDAQVLPFSIMIHTHPSECATSLPVWSRSDGKSNPAQIQREFVGVPTLSSPG